MFTMGWGFQWTPTDISAGTCFVHYPYVIFLKRLSSEVAKCNDDTRSVWKSKQKLVGNTEGSYNIDWEGIKSVAFECW